MSDRKVIKKSLTGMCRRELSFRLPVQYTVLFSERVLYAYGDIFV